MNNAKSILQTLNLFSNSSQLNMAKKLVSSFFHEPVQCTSVKGKQN